jgi:hypothetical protein
LAWISCSKCSKTKLLILADPPPPAKGVLLHPRCPWGTRHLLPDGSSDDVPHRSELPPPPGPVLSYGFRTRAAYQQPLQSY